MKVYRLLSILITLLNNDLVSATNKLAEKNEVSINTIQRDIETLIMAGIPVFYGILDTYKFDTKLLLAFEEHIQGQA